MTAFRKKTRSDEIIPADRFKPGLIVWVAIDGLPDRHMRFCGEQKGELLTPEEHKRRKHERAAHNRATHHWNGYRRHSQMSERRPHNSLAW